jgi:ATP-dependent Clp protease adaptor protein ClpS
MGNSEKRQKPRPWLDFKDQIEDKRERPRKWKVILLEDESTDLVFVVDVLQSIFHKTLEEAIALTMQIHHTGSAVCGTYTYEIAETKAVMVQLRASESGYPLMAVIDPE